jgi:hypothetical protein
LYGALLGAAKVAALTAIANGDDVVPRGTQNSLYRLGKLLNVERTHRDWKSVLFAGYLGQVAAIPQACKEQMACRVIFRGSDSAEALQPMAAVLFGGRCFSQRTRAGPDTTERSNT